MKKSVISTLKLLIVMLLLPMLFVACKKESDEDPDDQTDPAPVVDIDGNSYQTVKIGNQIWMAENLKTNKLSDGTLMENFDEYS